MNLPQVSALLQVVIFFLRLKRGTHLDFDLLKMFGKVTKYSPNGGVMVIYHGTKEKTQLQQIQAWSYTVDHF